MKKRGTAGLLGGALAVVLLAGNVLGGSYPAYAQDTQYHDGNYTASAHVEFHEVVNYDLYVTVSMKDGVISKVALNDEKNADIEAVNVPYINYAMKGMADSYIGTTGTAVQRIQPMPLTKRLQRQWLNHRQMKPKPIRQIPLPVTTDRTITRTAVTTQMIHKSLLMIKPIPAIQETTVMNVC